MGYFTLDIPAQLRLSATEESQRAAAIAASGSPSPVPFAPIQSPPGIYTHVGHAAQYGLGRRNGRTVRMITLHTTESDSSALQAASYDARRPDSVSANAFVGPGGELVYDVGEANRAFTTGRWNDESLSIEIVGRAAWGVADWHGRDAQLEGIVRLLVDWCRRWSIPAVWLSADEVAFGASREGSTPVQGSYRGITDHWTANQAAISLGGSPLKYSHSDVGPALRAIVVGELIPEVAQRLIVPPSEEDDMASKKVQVAGDPAIFAVTPALTAIWMRAGVDTALAALGVLETQPDGSAFIVPRLAYKGLELVGPNPDAGPTVPSDFAKHSP